MFRRCRVGGVLLAELWGGGCGVRDGVFDQPQLLHLY